MKEFDNSNSWGKCHKSLNSKSLDLNKTSNSSLSDIKTDKNIFNKNMKNVIQKSSSAEDIFNYEKKILNLFKFPTVLKSDTKNIFDNFFENIYDRKKIKKFNLTKIKFDYEPLYLNKFKNISKLEPQKELEFLYHVINHLQEQVCLCIFLNPFLLHLCLLDEVIYITLNYIF